MRQLLALIIALVSLAGPLPAAQTEVARADTESLKFAVIGDNGTGEKPEYEVGSQMAAARASFPFEFVLMLGDNMYGSQEPQDFLEKFEKPYSALLQAGVVFYATLGNHDRQTNRNYKPFNMNGERYYTFARANVRFFVFDTNMLDPAQVEWIKGTLKQGGEDWKICYFHHPLYSDAGRHGPNVDLRVVLEPLLLQAGVSVVLSGHEHVYERLVPQKGITYFIEGASGQLRKGDLDRSPTMAAGFDQDQSFMLVEIAGNEMRFRTISRTGRVVDSGVVYRRLQT